MMKVAVVDFSQENGKKFQRFLGGKKVNVQISAKYNPRRGQQVSWRGVEPGGFAEIVSVQNGGRKVGVKCLIQRAA